MAFKMSDDSRTTLEHKTPESNKSAARNKAQQSCCVWSTKNAQIPPDLVVKCQGVDIVDVIL